MRGREATVSGGDPGGFRPPTARAAVSARGCGTRDACGWSPRRLVRNWDQAVAAAHVLFEQLQERFADRSGLPVADDLIIPLDDWSHLDRAAKLQHLAARPGLGHRDVAD